MREKFDNAVIGVRSGQSSVVIAESLDGSASRLVERIPEDIRVHSRLACGQVCLSSVGQVADDLDLDGFHGGAIVLEDAQWADPTSLGHLQRVLASTTDPVLMIIAHRPVSDIDGWWLQRLKDTVAEHADVIELVLEPVDLGTSAEHLDGPETDLAVAASLVTGPLSVTTCARLLGVTEDEALTIGTRLVDEGLLLDSRLGFSSLSGGSLAPQSEARIGHVAGRLADAMTASGESPAIIGALRVAAGQTADAVPLLVDSAREANSRHASGEAFHLAESALAAADESGLEDNATRGEMHLICGRFLRTAGRTEWANRHLEHATSLLDGEDRVEALRLAAAVADDGQRPQTAERIIAMAEYEALSTGLSQMVPPLLTFRARTLNRIGFAEESDAALEKAFGMLGERPAEDVRFQARLNRAWIHFDRGEVNKAEVEFTQLRDDAEMIEGVSSLADKEAWRARALFAAGRPTEALAAVGTAQDLSAANQIEAPVFLAQLALAEGGLAFGRYEDALHATERALDLVERQLPAWENMVRSLRASALLRLGRLDEAHEEIGRALAATPSGSDGWRWRIRCQAIELEITAASGGAWRDRAADDLADHMLQSRLYGWAAELLCVIAEHDRRRDAATDALALAVVNGNPMLAARAAEAGKLWDDPMAAPAIIAIQAISHRLPEGWDGTWTRLPSVASALALPEPTDDEAFAVAAAAMDDALHKSGLANVDAVLSPAQRRSTGLVRRSRRTRPLVAVAAVLGVVLLAGATAFGVAQLTSPDPTAPAAPVGASPSPVTTTEEPLTIEETQLAVDNERGFLFGTSELRGTPGRGGFVDVAGPRSISGYYWKVRTAGAIDATPVAFGQQLFVGTTEGTFYALDQTTGEEIWTLAPEGRISTAAALGLADVGEGRTPSIVVVADDAGVVRAHQAGISGAAPWSTQLEGRIRSSPIVVDGQVVVATSEGFLHGLDLIEGGVLWTYPSEGDGFGSVSADLAYDDGLVYAGTQDGTLIILDVTGETPELVCTFDARDPIVVNPIVVDDVAYIGTTAHNIWVLPAGRCDGQVTGRLPLYVTETPVDVAPAVVGDIMYIPDGPYLYAKNLDDNTDVWTPGDVDANSAISASPVVTQDAVYFASEDGMVHAVDAFSGEALWTWQTGLHVRGSPAVVDDVVYVVSGDGFVYALGE